MKIQASSNLVKLMFTEILLMSLSDTRRGVLGVVLKASQEGVMV